MPLLPPIAAGWEGVIWVIILIFWGIAQALQKSRNERRRNAPPAAPPRLPSQPPRAPYRPVVDPEEQIRELLRELTGADPVVVEPDDVPEEIEPARPPPPPPPPSVRERLMGRVNQRRAQLEAEEARIPVSVPLALPFDKQLALSVSNALETAMKPVASNFISAVHMRNIGINGMAMHLPDVSGKVRTAPALSVGNLRNRSTLRQVILGRMILSQPRALEPFNGPGAS